MPITLSNGDFDPIDGFSEPLRLTGVYTITLTAVRPGGAEVLLYRRTPDCEQIYRIVGGAQGATLGSSGITVTKTQPSLADGCYSLYLNASGGAQVTVTLSR